MKTTFFLLFFSIPIFCISQEIQALKFKLDSLQNSKTFHQSEIDRLNIEIRAIENEIAVMKIEEMKANSIIAVTVDKLKIKLRDKSSAGGEIIAILPNNVEVEVLEAKFNYYKVIYKGQTGYLSELYLKESEELALLKQQINLNVSKSSLTPSKSNNSYQPSRSKSTQRRYITGPRGGCYYINSNGKKTYVNRSLCN